MLQQLICPGLQIIVKLYCSVFAFKCYLRLLNMHVSYLKQSNLGLWGQVLVDPPSLSSFVQHSGVPLVQLKNKLTKFVRLRSLHYENNLITALNEDLITLTFCLYNKK